MLNNPFKMNKKTGFTLIELMVTISVASIFLTMSVPSMKKMLQQNKITALHNQLLSALSFTRNNAITRGSWATLCHSNAARTRCTTPDSSWVNGWIIFHDKDNDGIVDSNETILTATNKLPASINILSYRSRISYSSQGYAVGYAGKITFCDSQNIATKKGMIVSSNGRVRTATSSDTLATCPD